MSEELENLKERLNISKKILGEMKVQESKSTYTDANPRLALDIKTKENEIISLEKKIQLLEGKKSESNQLPEGIIPFINRSDEINLITSSFAPAYYVIDAPEGFGKTELLKQLKFEFDRRNWLCSYISVSEADSPAEMLMLLTESLGITEKYESRNGEEQERWLVGAVKRLWIKLEENDSEKDGMVLLLDLDKRPATPILKMLLTSLIPKLNSGLRDLKKFQTKHNLFRVVLAGRQLANLCDNIGGHEFSLKVLRLSPFSYDVVKESIKEYKKYLNPSALNQFTADLLFFTGGHPGCVSEILGLYDEKGDSLESFFSTYQDAVWNNIISPKIDDIRSNLFSVAPVLERYVDSVSVYRYLDYNILDRIVRLNNLAEEHIANGVDLADELTKSYFLSRKARLLKDDITRRLFVIRQWHFDPSGFQASCSEARKIYLENLKPNLKIPYPERWTIESLFQALQQHAGFIQNQAVRKNIRDEFIKIIIPETLSCLLESRNSREEFDPLMQAMDEDWEFQFTIDYYLREDEFGFETSQDRRPYLLIKKSIADYFSNH